MGLSVKDDVGEAIEALKSEEGALLPILHGIQDRIGHVPRESIPIVAKALDLSRAEVHGVVTFYHHFRSEPAGRCVVQVCRAEACQALGSGALESTRTTFTRRGLRRDHERRRRFPRSGLLPRQLRHGSVGDDRR